MKFIVKNVITDTAIAYTDITKARIALDYLNFMKVDTPWRLEIQAA